VYCVQEFCEECEGQYRVVKRDTGRLHDAELPGLLRQRTGELIYVGLRDGFRVSGKPWSTRYMISNLKLAVLLYT
jgi:hypothetical protein